MVLPHTVNAMSAEGARVGAEHLLSRVLLPPTIFGLRGFSTSASHFVLFCAPPLRGSSLYLCRPSAPRASTRLKLALTFRGIDEGVLLSTRGAIYATNGLPFAVLSTRVRVRRGRTLVYAQSYAWFRSSGWFPTSRAWRSIGFPLHYGRSARL